MPEEMEEKSADEEEEVEEAEEDNQVSIYNKFDNSSSVKHFLIPCDSGKILIMVWIQMTISDYR